MRRKFIFLTAAFVLLAFFVVPLGMRGQTRDVETFTFSELGYGNAVDVTTVEGTNVTLTFAQGTSNNAPKYYTTGSGVRMYTGNTLEVALNDQEGETRITAINFTFSGTYTGSLQNWIGSETSVSFTNTDSGQARIQVIEVTYSEGGVAPTTYTVTYNANVAGVNPVVDTYVEGADVTLRPANTFNYEGHTFSEWNTQADGDGDPYDAGDEIVNIQANLQLYAIWIEDTPSGDGVVDVLNWVATGSPNSYTDWTYQAPSGTEYAGQSSGTYQSIQLRSSNNNSGIVTTTSIGNVTKVAVSWNDNTAIGRTLNVYGSNSSYSAATDLYGDNAGELLGTIVKGTNTVLNINGNYAFIGLRSASGALYLDEIDITWSVDGTPVPSITAGNVEIAYNATNGAIEYTINNPAEGGVLSATTEAEWLTIGTVGATVPFTCSMNDNVERTATVTLTYTYNSGQTISKNVTVTQASNPNAPGSETNPYTVAQARAAIDAGMGTQGVYATGIVSEIPTPYNSTYGNVTFNMVDEAGDEVFLQAYRCGGEEAANVAIGDVVVVYGNLTKHGSTYEFGQGCEVVSLIHLDIPSITVTPATVNFAATGTNGIQMDSLTIVYENIMVTNYQSFTVQFYDNQGNETTVPTDWLIVGVTGTNEEGYVVRCVVGDNDGEARTAYFKVYAFDAENNKVYSNLVTVNQAKYVVDYATLPFEFDGGRADIEDTDGLTQKFLGSDYPSSPKLKFNNQNDSISCLVLKFNEVPGTLTFDIKGNSFSNGTFKVQTSEDGVTYTDLETYTNLTATVQSKEFNNLGENVRYIKWIYINKVSGNVALGNIHLYEFGGGPVIETYDLTVEPFENLEIFTFVDDDLTEPMEGAGTIQVAEGKNVMLSVSANEGYEIQSLMVDGTEHVNDIAEDLTYTFVMPAHNVTVSATAAQVVPFEPATYTLATTIESGKTYIIVGSKVIDSVANYFAMGEQRTNNRGGVAISVDGTTATVDSEDVYEFVITDIGDGFYSLYDDRTPGYLYAAGPSNNYLRTELELDTLHNGDWAINIDEQGMFSIAASNSSNRNVMQFNGSGSNALFACYALANQSPVYLYVKDEEATVTQTIALNAGWNWVSFNVEVTLDDLKAALVDSLSGSIVTIKSQNDGLTIFNGTRWRGALSSLDVTQMYKIKVDTSCEIMLEGKPINPVEHPITIRRGVNWIGFPLSQSMTLSDVFGSFAVNGDRIASKTQNIVYNGGWRGRLTTLEPGQGYVYTSNQVDDRVFVFPANTK